MTAATQPLGRLATVLEHFLQGLAWTTQAAAATAYLTAAAHPSAWRDMFAKDAFSTIMIWFTGVGTVMLWVAGLREETKLYYNRYHQRIYRKAGLLGHASTLMIAAVAAMQLPHRFAWLALFGIVFLSATCTWTAWMQTQLLPEEDQAVIDVVLHKEAVQRAAVYQASNRERRRARLTAILDSLGYIITDTPPKAGQPAEPTPIWTIPAGKHAPLVYFIRNGNRMKIGTTTELKRRIRTLALRPENVVLLVNGDQRREREFHKQFAEHRIGNTEWFAYEGSLADHVTQQVAALSRKEQQK